MSAGPGTTVGKHKTADRQVWRNHVFAGARNTLCISAPEITPYTCCLYVVKAKRLRRKGGTITM